MPNATYYIRKLTSGSPTGRLFLQTDKGVTIKHHDNDGTDAITFDRSSLDCTNVNGWYVTVTNTTFGTPTALTFTSDQASVSTVAANDHYVIFFCDRADSTAPEKAPSNCTFTLKKKNSSPAVKKK